MGVYIVVEFGWDHHENKAVFDDYQRACIFRDFLNEKKTGRHYEIEEFKLNHASAM